MKVGELIALLENYEEDCEVLLVTQQNWPFEYSVLGVTDRTVCGDPDYDDNDDDGDPTDVFIVEGQQLRYGMKSAWENV